MLQTSKGRITPFNESNIPTDITFLGVSTVRKKFRLTVVYLNWCCETARVRLPPSIRKDIPSGITFLNISIVKKKF